MSPQLKKFAFAEGRPLATPLVALLPLTLLFGAPATATPNTPSPKKKTPDVTEPAPVAAAAPVVKEPRCEVEIIIDNVRKNGDHYQGQICYTVFKGKEGFPDKSELAYKNHCVPVHQSPTVAFTLKELPCNQDYGVALLHDENMHRQLDKNLAIPKEGIGMSNNPSFIRVNSPSFDEVKFMVQNPRSTQTIRIHYF